MASRLKVRVVPEGKLKIAILLVAIISITGMSIGIAAAAESESNDVLVWQGQYFKGDKFQTGTYEFNFTVYDALDGWGQCYSNTTTLTTGNWGEWKTEQYGVSAACNNVSKSYFLEIAIGGDKQPPRRRLTAFSFLRKSVNETVIQVNTQVISPLINATRIAANELTVSSDANIFGILRGHSPLKIGDSIQYVDKNDTNLFSVYTAGQNITGSNVSSQYNGVIVHQIESHTNPSGIEECWWDREDQEMRMCLDKTKIEIWNDMLIDKI